MSKEIEQRVVEMRFDNKQFEANASTSMSTLDKLKQKLNFTGASKGLENVSAAAKNTTTNMSPLSSAVQTVQAKFSSLEVIGMTALSNITNSAVNAGKRIVSALTIDPIKTGFQEYETQINAVQTILANTSHQGTNLEQVNAALDELNKYADQTIYNFTEMTRNIGTFTAAGVDLETSVGAIKGIANLAAVSGSNAQQASNAMYQLSQAIAAGRVSLQDWNSVVNAGMGGKVFQDALMNTAEAMGIVVDRSKSFRESISAAGGNESWLTSEVLLNTLNQFTGDLTDAELAAMGFTEAQIKNIQQMAATAQGAATDVKTFTQLVDTIKESVTSGWAQTWEIIFGDFEEAKALFSEISDTIGGVISKFSDARNNLLEDALGSKWGQLTDQINEAGVATEDFNKELEKTVKSHGKDVDSLIKEYGSLEKAFSSGALSSDLIVETLKRMSGATEGASKSTENMTDKLEYFQKVVDDVWRGDYKNGEERIKALTAAGYDYAQVQSLVNKTVDGHRLTLEDLSDTQLKSIGYTDEQVKKIRKLAEEAEKAGTPLNELIADLEKPSGRELLVDSFRNALQGLIKVCGAVGEAWRNAFPPMTSDELYKIIEAIHEFSKNLNPTTDTVDKLTRSFKGLFAIIDIITTITGGAFKIAFKAITSILGMANVPVLDLTANIGDAIVAFRDWLFEGNALAQGLEKLVGWLKTARDAFIDWYNWFIKLPVVQENITRFGEAFNKTFGNVSDHFSEVGKRFAEFIDRVKEMDGITLDNISEVFTDFYDNVLSYIFNFDGVFNDLGSAVEGFKNSVISYFQDTGTNIVDLKDKIVDFALTVKEKFSETIGVGELLTIGVGVAIVLFVKKLGDAISVLAGPLEGFSDVLEGLGSVLKSYALNLKAEALKSVAISIAILAGSIVVLTYLDQNKLWSAVGALGVLALGLVGISTALGTLNKVGGSVKAAGGMLGIAGSILILTTALKQLDGMDGDSLKKNLGILGILAAGLTAVSIAIGRFSSDLTKSALFLISMAVSMKILISAMNDLSKMNPDDIVMGLAAIIPILGMFAVITLASALAGKNAAKAGVGILAMSASLLIIVQAIKMISNIDPSRAAVGLAGIYQIFTMFALLMAASLLAGKNATKAGVGILAMSASLLIIVGVIKLLSGMNENDLTRGVAAVSMLMVVFGLVTALSKLAGKNATKAGTMLLMMSASIMILVGAIAVLSLLDPEGLDQALGAVVVLEAMFAALIAVTKLAGDARGTLVVLAVTIGLLAVALGALSMINPDNLKVATASLSLVIAAFSLLVASTSLAKKATGTLVVITAVVAALGVVLYSLAELPAQSTLAVAEALSLLLVSLSASLVLIGKAGTISADAYPALVVMLLVVGGLATVLGMMGAMEVEPSIETATALSVLLIAFSASILLISNTKDFPITAALKGIAVLIVLIAAIGALIVGIGALVEQFPQLEQFLDTGIPILEKIGMALGSFFGNIIGGFAKGITDALPAMGQNIGDFMTNAQPFFEGANNIDPSAMSGVKTLAETILILTGANILDGVARFLGQESSLLKFAEELKEFAPALKEYSDIITSDGGIDGAAVEASANTAKLLAEFANSVPARGGIIADWLGENSLVGFAEELKKFAPALKEYSDIITKDGGIDGPAVEASANAARTLSEFANSVPSRGGKIAEWLGENSLTEFAEELKDFAPALKEYSDIITKDGGIDGKAIEASANAAKTLSEFANSVPSRGGTISEWLGENSLTGFAEELKNFAPALKEYSDTIIKDGGIDGKAVEASANAASCLSELADNLPKHDGLLQWFTGDTTLSAFGDELRLFGYDFSAYSNTMKNVKPSVLESTTAAAESIVVLAEKIPDYGWFSGNTSIETFGAQLKGFGNSFYDYYETISDINTEKLTDAITQLDDLVDIVRELQYIDPDSMTSFSQSLSKLGKEGVEDFIKTFSSDSFKISKTALDDFGNRILEFSRYLLVYYNNVSSINMTKLSSSIEQADNLVKMAKGMSGVDTKAMSSFSQSLAKLGKEGINEFIRAFNNAGSRVSQAASSMMSQFISGANSKKTEVSSTFTTLVTSVVTNLNRKKQEFVSVGQSFMTSFISGIKSREASTKTAFSSLISSVLTSIKNKYSEFQTTGQTLIVKLIAGVTSKKSAVKNEFLSVTSAAISAIRSEYQGFYKAGEYLVEGFCDGLEDNLPDVRRAARELASAAKSSAMNALDAHSPSKEFIKIGSYVSSGFAKGMEQDERDVKNSATSMARTAVEGAKNAISKIVDYLNNDIDTEPTIRPVLDLSELEAGTSKLNTMFTRNRAVSIGAFMNQRPQTTSTTQNGETSTQNGNVYTFTQNNYSPKALSRVEIYRQTKNQFSAMERMVQT